MNRPEEAKHGQCVRLASLLHENTAILQALGDETNQYILTQMILKAGPDGLRIGEIASLSRAAASRHIQILMKAGLLQMRKEGTKHYYLFARKSPVLYQLHQLLELSIKILDEFNDTCPPEKRPGQPKAETS